MWECHESKYPYLEKLRKLGKFKLLKQVQLGKIRPKLPSPERSTSTLSKKIIALMQECWRQDPKKRYVLELHCQTFRSPASFPAS